MAYRLHRTRAWRYQAQRALGALRKPLRALDVRHAARRPHRRLEPKKRPRPRRPRRRRPQQRGRRSHVRPHRRPLDRPPLDRPPPSQVLSATALPARPQRRTPAPRRRGRAKPAPPRRTGKPPTRSLAGGPKKSDGGSAPTVPPRFTLRRPRTRPRRRWPSSARRPPRTPSPSDDATLRGPPGA